MSCHKNRNRDDVRGRMRGTIRVAMACAFRASGGVSASLSAATMDATASSRSMLTTAKEWPVGTDFERAVVATSYFAGDLQDEICRFAVSAGCSQMRC